MIVQMSYAPLIEIQIICQTPKNIISMNLFTNRPFEINFAQVCKLQIAVLLARFIPDYEGESQNATRTVPYFSTDKSEINPFEGRSFNRATSTSRMSTRTRQNVDNEERVARMSNDQRSS